MNNKNIETMITGIVMTEAFDTSMKKEDCFRAERCASEIMSSLIKNGLIKDDSKNMEVFNIDNQPGKD